MCVAWPPAVGSRGAVGVVLRGVSRALQFEDLARRRVRGILEVGQLSIDPRDGVSIVGLLSDDDGRAALVRWGELGESPRILVGPPEDEATTTWDELSAERARRAWGGVSAFRPLGAERWCVSVGGRWEVVDDEGRAVGGYDLAGAVAVATSETSDVVAATDGHEVWIAGPGRRERLAVDHELSLGLAEYVAQEEFGRFDGLWLSPSGRRVAWTEVDERMVPEHVIVHHDVVPARLERHRYPFVGSPNASVAVVVYDREGGASLRRALTPEGGYLVEVCWVGDDALVVGVVDRAQHELTRWRIELPDGATVRVDREAHEPWINVPATVLVWGRTLVTTSQRFDGQWRVVLIGEEGVRRLADGVVVTALVGLAGDELIAVGYDDDPVRRSLWRIHLRDGSVRELDRGGVFGPVAVGARAVAAVRSSLEEPPALVRYGEEPELVAASEPELELRPPRRVEVDLGDGLVRFGAVYEPPGGATGRPLILSVYGGPHVQLVQDAWQLTADLSAQWLAMLGAVVLKLDGRGSANRGRVVEEPLAAGFGTVELEDHIAAIDWAARALGIDAARVGIYGWSYGGYLTLLATSRYPERFRVGVAGAPVVDFRWYDTGYSERYLGLAGDPRYDRASVVASLEGLRGPTAPRVLIIHGLVDENVHVSHTLRLLERAQELGIDLPFVALPSSRHGPRAAHALATVARVRTEFLATHLGLG